MPAQENLQNQLCQKIKSKNGKRNGCKWRWYKSQS